MDPGIDRCQVYCWVCVYGMAIEQFPRDDRTPLDLRVFKLRATLLAVVRSSFSIKSSYVVVVDVTVVVNYICNCSCC